jgi:hypothetical protein
VELEVEVEVEELSGVWGVLAQIVDALQGGCEVAYLWASDQLGLDYRLKQVLRSYEAVVAYVGAHHPGLRHAVLGVRHVPPHPC